MSSVHTVYEWMDGCHGIVHTAGWEKRSPFRDVSPTSSYEDTHLGIVARRQGDLIDTATMSMILS